MVSILHPLIRCLEKIYIASFDIKVGGSHTFQSRICDKYLDTIDSRLKRRFPDVDLLESFGILWSHASGELASHFTSSLVTLPEIKIEWEQFKSSATSFVSSILQCGSSHEGKVQEPGVNAPKCCLNTTLY